MNRQSDRRNPAIESLKQRMARDPLSRVFLQLAEEYRKEGNYEEAIRVCLEGLGRHPAYHTARIALGRTYLECGNLEEARKTLSEVLDLAPENHLAGKLLAEVQRKLGDSTAAVETYRTILRHYPGDREVVALLNDLLKGASSPAAPRPEAPVRAPAAQPPRPVPATAPVPVPAPAARPRDPVIEYRSEDLAGPAAAGAAPGASDALQTNTLAELYLRQGLVDKAMEVYRAMLRVDPGNERARRRLQELAGAPAAGSAVAAPPRPIVATGAATRGAPAAAPARTARHRARIDRLERWLGSMRAGTGSEAGTR